MNYVLDLNHRDDREESPQKATPRSEYVKIVGRFQVVVRSNHVHHGREDRFYP